MLIIERKILFLKDKMVFYPDAQEMEKLIKDLGSFEFLKVKESFVDLPENASFLNKKGEFKTAFIDLRKSLDDIWQNMEKSSCRYEINKAKKWEDKIRIAVNENPHEFRKLYNDFVEKKKHTFQLSESRLKDYLKVSDIFLCYFENELLVGHLLLRDKKAKIVRLVFSASKRLEDKRYSRLTGPLNRYLHWYEISYYKEMGIETYDLGGIGKIKRRAGRFKLSLGGKVTMLKSYSFSKGIMRVLLKLYQLIFRILDKLFLKA